MPSRICGIGSDGQVDDREQAGGGAVVGGLRCESRVAGAFRCSEQPNPASERVLHVDQARARGRVLLQWPQGLRRDQRVLEPDPGLLVQFELLEPAVPNEPARKARREDVQAGSCIPFLIELREKDGPPIVIRKTEIRYVHELDDA